MPLLSILGPTAGGKSDLALLLAEKINGEIISCDSMQVYQGMDIGTAKPSASVLASLPHHLISCFDLNVRYSASMFCELAEPIIADIEKRGKQPILAGGSGMYARLLLYGNNGLPADRDLHASLKLRLAAEGRELLLAELQAIDPLTATKVGNNDRRLIRALEVVMLTGEPIPQKTSPTDEPTMPGLQVINMCSPELNRERIAMRTRKMLRNGWIEETEKLIAKGLWSTPTACQSLGYRQVGEYLAGKLTSMDSLMEKIITLTCRYAKKQRTWFRNQHYGAVSISRQKGDDPEVIANQIIESFLQIKAHPPDKKQNS